MIKISIVDKDHMSRDQVKSILQIPGLGDKEFKLVHESDSSDFFTEIQPVAKTNILILEPYGQPNGIIRKLKELHPKMLIIIFSHAYSLKDIKDYLFSGAMSYLSKKSSQSYLYFTIFTTCKGGSFISPEICRQLILSNHQIEDRREMLTARELQIANSLVGGMSYKMIAYHYNISINTVRVYVKRIYNKFHIHSKGQLISQLTS